MADGGGIEGIDRWIEERAEEMASLVCDLVAVGTENPPGRALGRCADVLAAALARLGITAQRLDPGPAGALEEPCVLRAAAGDGPATVYLHGHLDVVPVQSPAQLVPRREDGRIVGRGTADMKGGLVAMAYAMAAARDLGLLDGRRAVLHVVPDEETGSVVGSGHLRAAGLIDASAVAMLTTEPTGGLVWHASRGALTLRVTVEGTPAHVGQAHLGVNAFEHLARIAVALSELAAELRERRTAFPIEPDAARGSMMVVGGVAGSGAGFNVVPGEAFLSVDRRFNPEEDLDVERARTVALVEETAAAIGARVRVDVLQAQLSAATATDHPAARALAACVEAVEGLPPRFQLCPGVLETRWYAQLGIPALAYGPGRLEVSHGPDEELEEAAMRRCARVYARFLAGYPEARAR